MIAQINSEMMQFSERERINSGISPEIWSANTEIIGPDDEAPDLPGFHLTYGRDYLGVAYSTTFSRFSNHRRNSLDGKWGHLRDGGIWFPGYCLDDPNWGLYKPISPRSVRDGEKIKPIKYEGPPGKRNGIFVPNIPPTAAIWQGRITAPLPGDEIVITPKDCAFPRLFHLLAREKSPLVITEGAKKALATVSSGFPAIAINGHTGGYRKVGEDRILLPEIVEVLNLGWSEVLICLDEDPTPATVKLVNTSRRRIASLIKQSFPHIKIRFLRWDPSQGKGIDDYLVGGGDISQLIDAAKYSPIRDWETRQSIGEFRGPVIPVECSPYLPPIDIPSSPIVFVKAPKGTGKTELLSRWIQSRNGQGINVALFHLNQLGENCCKRLNLLFNNSMTNAERNHLFSNIHKNSLFTQKGFGANIASLRRGCKLQFELGDWADNEMWLIIDEIEQVLSFALTAPILKSHRAEILTNLTGLIQTAYRAGKIVGLDADLSSLAISFIKLITGCRDKDICIIEGKRSVSHKRKAIIYDCQYDLIDEVTKRLESAQKGCFQTSAQKDIALSSAKNLESYFKRIFPNKKILRIDSETIADPDHSAYGIIGKGFPNIGNYDLVIYTPCLETGVDLNPEKMGFKWDYVAAMGWGVQTPERFCQGLERYRGNCERLIFAPTEASSRFLAHGGEIFPKKISITFEQYFGSTILDNIENWQSWARVNGTYAQMAARENLGKKHYRAAITSILEKSGYEIEAGSTLPTETRKVIAGEMRAIKNENWDNSIIQRLEVPTPDQFTALTLQGQSALTTEERAALAKWEIKERYGQISRPLIKADDEGFYRSAKLLFGLLVAAPYLPKSPKTPYLKDELSARIHQARIHQLSRIFIVSNLPLLNGENFTANHPVLAEIAAIPPDDFTQIFGRAGKGRDRGMARLRVIADLLGLEVRCVDKKTTPRQYALREKWQGISLSEIFGYWAAKEENVMTFARASDICPEHFGGRYAQPPKVSPHEDLGRCGFVSCLYNILICMGDIPGKEKLIADDQAGADVAGDDQAGDNQLGADMAGDDQAGDNQLGADMARDDQAGDNQLGADMAGDDQAGDNQLGADMAGDDQAGDNQLGADVAGDDQVGDDQLGADMGTDDQVGDDQLGADIGTDDQVGALKALKDEPYYSVAEMESMRQFFRQWKQRAG